MRDREEILEAFSKFLKENAQFLKDKIFLQEGRSNCFGEMVTKDLVIEICSLFFYRQHPVNPLNPVLKEEKIEEMVIDFMEIPWERVFIEFSFNETISKELFKDAREKISKAVCRFNLGDPESLSEVLLGTNEFRLSLDGESVHVMRSRCSMFWDVKYLVGDFKFYKAPYATGFHEYLSLEDALSGSEDLKKILNSATFESMKNGY